MSFIYADQQPDPTGLTPVKRYRERRNERERSRSRSRRRDSPERKRPRGATLEEKVKEHVHDQEEQVVVLHQEIQVEEDPGEGTSRGPRERRYSYDDYQPALLNEALIRSDDSDGDSDD